MERSQLIDSQRLVVHPSTASLPVPTTANDGVALDPWKTGMLGISGANTGRGPREVLIFFRGASGAVSASAGMRLYLYNLRDAIWYQGDQFNGGAAFTFSNTLGWVSHAIDCGVFSRIAVAGTVSDNTIVEAAPLVTYGGGA